MSVVKSVMDTHTTENKGPRVYRFIDSVKKALFVMGSCLLLFSAARNSFHWHIHRIWGATGSFWQNCWDYMYSNWGNGNDLLFSIVGTLVATFSVFWLSNLFFLILDLTGMPECMRKYKIQEDKKASKDEIWKAVKLVFVNQTMVGIPFVTGAAYLYQLRGCSAGELPTFYWVCFEILIFSLVEEVFFYYSHRLLHHRYLYRHIHKIHHEWTAPIGIVSIYAHPIEHLFSNMIPPTLGPLLMGSHIATGWLWFSIALMSTTVAHCGYHLPLFPSPEAHDYHHLKFTNNFGVLGVLDRLHGTDLQFRDSKQYKHHVMLLSLLPLSQQYPEEKTKKMLSVAKKRQ